MKEMEMPRALFVLPTKTGAFIGLIFVFAATAFGKTKTSPRLKVFRKFLTWQYPTLECPTESGQRLHTVGRFLGTVSASDGSGCLISQEIHLIPTLPMHFCI